MTQRKAPKGNTVIGIDLGTTYSCVACWTDNNRAEVISNDQGHRTTPSVVAFTGEEELVGDTAKSQATLNPNGTVFDVKRLIGLKFDDPIVQEEIKRFPYKVFDKDGRIAIQVTVQEQAKEWIVEEITARILGDLKQTAENFLNQPVSKAVITVPARFTDAQRQATKDAAKIAGLEVLRLVNEPTAAALAYGLERQDDEKEKKILVFDMGGGTLDVSVLTQAGGNFEVKGTAGNPHLGGEDIDNLLVDFFASEFQKKFKQDMTKNARSMRRLRNACEFLKRSLSTMNQGNLEVDSLFEGMDFYTTLSRSRFEDICGNLLRSTLAYIDQALEGAKLSKSDIDEVVLVGGSTRIPKLQQLISAHFDGKKLCNSINPDEAIAEGAAIQAAIIAGIRSEKTEKIVLLDVTPLSLGIETATGVFTVVVSRNSTYPLKKTKRFSTYQDNQTNVLIKVFQGERARTSNNFLLARFELLNIPQMPRAVPQIDVTFDIDANGILEVTAEDVTSNNKEKIKINRDSEKLSDEDIKRMIEDYNSSKSDDMKFLNAMETREELVSYVSGFRSAFDSLSHSARGSFSEDEIVNFNSLCATTLEWTKVHLEESSDVYSEKLKEVKIATEPMKAKIIKHL